MGAFVADATIKQMIKAGIAPKKSKVIILGLTFKENCPDTRNSKVEDIINRLAEYDIEPIVIDPWANPADAMREYNVDLKPMEEAKNADCVILAVAHNEFKELTWEQIAAMYKDGVPMNERVLIDVKGLRNRYEAAEQGYRYWRL